MATRSSFARRVVRVPGFLAIVAVALVFDAWAYLRSPWGAAVLGGRAERIVSDAIDGDVRLGKVGTFGAIGIRLERAVVVDPYGDPVIAVRDLRVKLSPWRLLLGELAADVRVRGGRVAVVEVPAEDDVNIGLAFQPEEPAAPPDEAPRPLRPLPPEPPVSIVLQRLAIDDTAFRLAPSHDAPPQVLVREIAIRSRGHWDDHGAEVELVLAAHALAPVDAPLALDVHGAFAENWLDALRVDVTLGATSLRVRGRGEMRALEGRVVAEGIVGASEARAIGAPLASDLDLDLDVWLSRTVSTVGLRAGIEGGGAVAVDGSFDRRDAKMHLQAVLAGADPAAFLEGAPSGAIRGVARASGVLEPAADLRFATEIERGTLAGRTIGPLRIAGAIEGRTMRIAPSSLVLPGAVVRIEGDASFDALDVRGSIEAENLAAAGGFGAALASAPAPPLAGRGSARFRIAGTPSAPRVRADLDLARLAWGEHGARDLELRADVLLGGALPSGTIAGRIAAADSPRLELRDLRIEASRLRDGRFSLDLSAVARARTQARADRIHLRAGGEVEEGFALVDRFALDFPRGSLRSEGRATVDFGAGDFSVEDLVLRQQGGGRLRLRGGVRGKDLRARVQGDRIRLDRLPQALLPADLAGSLQIDAELEGRLSAPLGHVRFRLVDGAWGPIRDLAARGDVRAGEGRAAGTLALALGGAGRVDAEFDLPLDPLGAPRATPLHLRLRAGPIDLGGLGRALSTALPQGVLVGEMRAAGAIGSPDFDADVFLSGFEIPDAPGLPRVAAHLRCLLDEGMARADLEAWAGPARVLEMTADAPLDVRRLRRDPEAEIDRLLGSRRSRARGAIRGLDLAMLGALLDLPLGGAAAAEFEVQGPIVDPRGRVRIEARGGPFGPAARLDLVSLVELLPDRSRLVAGLALDDQEPAEIRLEVQAPLRAILDGTAPPDAAAALALDLPAIDLARLGGRGAIERAARLVEGAVGEARGYGGRVRAEARFDGTLATLPGRLRIVGTDLVVRGVPIGGAELVVEQDERAVATLSAIDPGAGTLQASLSLDRAISPIAIARDAEAHLRALRARVRVGGVGLSLAPLAILSPIRGAAGTLELQASAEGPLLSLDPVGTLAVRDGSVELVGGPRYQDVSVDAELAEGRILRARARAAAPGRGALSAEGRLERADGPDPFRFEVVADAFPIGGPGGVAARISGRGSLEGRADPIEGVRATLRVPEAQIRLPRSPPRALQSVSRLHDVVIVTGPEAFLRERRRRLASRAAALPIELRVDAPRRIFVSGDDLDAELGAEVVVRRPPTGEWLAEGSARALRGQVRVLGRSFVVEEASALWGGGPLADPILSLTARYQTQDATAWVDVTGTASRPAIALRSDPPMPESQIALLIASGRTDLPGQTPLGETAGARAALDPAGTAASVAGSFAAQQLRRAIGPRLPLDVLTLETGDAGARLEAGTYVSERLYLGYLRNFLPDEGENRNEVRAEYELSRTVSLESRFGDRGAAGVDLVWEKRIATPAQQRARRAEREERRAAEQEPRMPEGRVEPGEDAPAAFEPEDGGDG